MSIIEFPGTPIPNAFFITGSDTNVGKTVITALLAATAQADGQSVCVYKPIQTGSPDGQNIPDLEMVSTYLDNPVDVANSYNLIPPVAPFVATAVMEAEDIDCQVIHDRLKALSNEYDLVLVEGAGGVRVPIAPEVEQTDLIKQLGIPVIVVVRPDLGTINHTQLTLEALTHREIPIHAVVVSNMPETTDDLAIESLPWVFENFLEVDASVIACPPLDLPPNGAPLNAEHPVVQQWQDYEIV